MFAGISAKVLFFFVFSLQVRFLLIFCELAATVLIWRHSDSALENWVRRCCRHQCLPYCLWSQPNGIVLAIFSAIGFSFSAWHFHLPTYSSMFKFEIICISSVFDFFFLLFLFVANMRMLSAHAMLRAWQSLHAPNVGTVTRASDICIFAYKF